MKHKVKVMVETEKRGLFGRRRTVLEKRTMWVDDETYREIRRQQKEHARRPYSMEEMMFYDDLFED